MTYKIFSVALLVLGVLAGAYGLAVSSAGSGTTFYLIWFLIAAVLLLLGILLLKGLWPGLARWLRRAIVCVIAFAVLVVAVSWGFILGGFDDKGKPGLDVIIVLGAQVRADGPSTVLQYRLEAAYEYLLANPKTLCVCAGGQGSNEPEPEGAAMKKWLVAKGLDESRIIAETKSYNTVENLNFAAQELAKTGLAFGIESSSVGVITNNFHVFRALLLAKSAGYKEVYGIAAKSKPFYLLHNMLRETAGLAKEIVYGNL